jgi:hypothetical protein
VGPKYACGWRRMRCSTPGAGLPRRPEQYLIPVEVQKLTLARREPADVEHRARFDAHALQRRPVSVRRDDERAVVLEADKPPVEQMVDTR